MSRAAWIGLILLGGGMGLLSYLLFAELNGATIHRANHAIEHTTALYERSQKSQKAAQALVDAHDGLKDIPTVAADLAVIDAQVRDMNQLKQIQDNIQAKLAENKAVDDRMLNEQTFMLENQVSALPWSGLKPGLILTMQKVNHSVESPAELAVKRIERSAAWFSDFPGNLKRAQKSFGAGLSEADLASMKTKRDAFLNQFPESKMLRVRLDGRIDRMTNLTQLLKTTQTTLQTAAQSTPPNAQMAATADAERRTALETLGKAKAEWAESTALLPVDVDKVLVDMQITSKGVRQHKLKIIQNGQATESGWQSVTKKKYSSHIDHLGMTIYSKPAGYMPEDAITVAAPPGYQYIGNPRYGQWRQRNGVSFWVFYGQYALMRDLFWGVGGYRPIVRSEYRGYRSSIKRRRAYFGAKKQYGTAKAVKSKRYSKSKYATKHRSKTRYSGSKYSGSKRSGGYRNSRYRSSSFGGGGK